MSWRRIPHSCCRGLCRSPLLPSYTKEANIVDMTHHSRMYSVAANNGTYQRLLKTARMLLEDGVYHKPCRTFLLGNGHHKESEKAPENEDVINGACKSNAISNDGSQQLERPDLLWARRKGLFEGKRRLSPFQRVQDMMKENTSQPVIDKGPDHNDTNKEIDGNLHTTRTSPGLQETNAHPSVPLTMGEYVVIYRRSNRGSLNVLVKLHEASKFDCKWGSIPHSDIIGQPGGQLFKTHLGTSFAIRRPSLEDFVLLMKRGPTILYPKDANTMLMMTDVSPGDVILEAGTGSGAMTLHLSRAVGSLGRVLTFEARNDHHERAVSNWRKWKVSWDISHANRPWPDNVTFHNTPLRKCEDVVADELIDGVTLDVGDPVNVLPIVCRKLKPGKVIAVYVAQITLVVDILNAIRTLRLPLMLETVLEVSHKSWLVKAASIHDDSSNQQDRGTEVDNESRLYNEADNRQIREVNASPSINHQSTKYICRPEHIQMPHTGFLVQLRKITAISDVESVRDD